jgi:GDP-L-fucose synthase
MANVLITGSTGFLASHLIPILEQDYSLYLALRPQYDLRQEKHIDKLLIHSKPNIIIHLAADVGGLQYNLDNPASIYYNNVMMNTQLIHRAATFGIDKFIFVSSACAYPKFPPIPTKEFHLWKDFPEESNGSYGISKRIALTQLEAYKKQWDMDFEYPILSNLYGPGDKSSHVIPMLIEKFQNGKVEVWGDGSVTRDFLYVEDAARAIKKLIDIDIGKPVNIAHGNSITIKMLVEYLIELFDYKGEIIYNTDKPVGQMRRSYSIQKAERFLNWQPETSIKEGLRKVIYATYTTD